MSNEISEPLHIKEMYEDYFLEYASYVITDRAVPYLDDGLKPVQRRILHSLFEVNDGRFHKAANVIGNTMKYHPHGDAAIRDALVHVAQKGLMIDTQGNWGDPITGDAAAAPRYIECKLSPFALDVAFNKRTTEWQNSYDGRNKEPIALPVKFPLLLAQGAEGIAVGLATKILPHNFVELIQNSIKILKKKSFKLYPDFLSGGHIDVSNYNDGKPGGKVKVRAKIEKGDKRTLVITEVPYSVTTNSLMDSIVSANEKGKLKVKKIEDNTAAKVEIIITLPPGADEDKVIDALYAFTDCEVSISPNCCVIRDKRPKFIGVSELLRENVKDTVDLLKLELEIKKNDLEEKWHMRTLERIFIEERIYRKIENCTTWEAIVKTIHKGLDPFKKQFIRKVTDEDMEKLTEIKIKRISKFDSAKADEELIALEKALKEVKRNLRKLTDYAIAYYERILEKYGADKKRKTKIDQFEEIEVSEVILSNLKVGYDRKSGFIGTSVRGDGQVTDCSKLDDIIVFTEDGSMIVTKIVDKVYVGKNILHAAKFDKSNLDTIYNMIYRDGRSGSVYVKRFAVGGVTRNKNYNLTKGKDNSKVHYLSIGTKITSEEVVVKHAPKPRIKKEFKLKFGDYEVKGRGSGGNIITKHGVKKVAAIEGTGAAKGSKKKASAKEESGTPFFWNKKGRQVGFKVKGDKICNLEEGEQILILYDDGSYITFHGQESLEVGEGILHIDKWNAKSIFSAIYVDGNSGNLYGKKFSITSATDEKYFYYISDYEDSELKFLTNQAVAVVDIHMTPQKGKKTNLLTISFDEENFPVEKVSKNGKKITNREVKKVELSKKKQLSLL